MAIMDTLQGLLGRDGIRYSPLGGEGKTDPLSRLPRKPLLKLIMICVMSFMVLTLVYMYASSETIYGSTDSTANVVQPAVQATAGSAPTFVPEFDAGVSTGNEEHSFEDKPAAEDEPEGQLKTGESAADLEDQAESEAGSEAEEAQKDGEVEEEEKQEGEEEEEEQVEKESEGEEENVTGQEGQEQEGQEQEDQEQEDQEQEEQDEEEEEEEEEEGDDEEETEEKTEEQNVPALPHFPASPTPAHIEIVDNPPTIDTSDDAPSYDFSPGNKKLTVVVFASDPGPALCKVMMSAIIMGYPMPHMVNWGLHLKDTFPGYIRAQGNIGNHQLKVVGSLSYLDELSHPTTKEEDRLNDDDLVLMVDAYDVWFQTPPEVLISRYHEANRLANNRLQKQWKGQGKAPMNQTIVFSSQKKCFPTKNSAYQMQCDHLPDSPLRKDLYGKKTDKHETHYRSVRPKYINSGAIMGPVGDLKRYIRKVSERLGTKALNQEGNMPSDQGMFGEIWGEQEVYRTWLRNQTAKRQFQPKDLFMTQRDYEFGVGMDYKQDICIATVFEEKDGQIFQLENKTFINEQSKELKIKPPRLKGVPEDLEQSRNPMDILDIPEDEKLNWGEMPMYADFFTESVPVMVHHNAHAHGLKSRNQEWWDKMWYFPYFRDLITKRLSQFDESPLGSVKSSQKPLKGKKDEEDIDMITYYPLISDRYKRTPRIYRPGQAMDSGLDSANWEEVCFNRKEPEQHWSEEVFRDGKGGLNGEVAPPSGAEEASISG